jgi:alpha-L-fucosidase
MKLSRRTFIFKSAAAAASLSLWQAEGQSAKAAALSAGPAAGPFQPSWDSLAQYQCPEWFRDAKFGIWAHWSAQCVPEQGDWYGRQMYQEGNSDYEYQVAHYGHPSKVGFKDIDHIWHAENWDPAHLISLYQAAGAKYFVALAQHHDNFDCFDSKYQPWNSVAIGPKKDIVGTWAKVARQAGLNFGVSSHGSHAWSWFEVAQGADTKGPLAGVPYDGHLTKADGKGQWWEGLDPQDLYAQNHAPMGLEWDWNNNGHGDLPSRPYMDKFYNRTVDLIDKYHPDLIYFDDTILPLYEVDPAIGLNIAAHHYNTSLKIHGGKMQAVLTGKGLSDSQQRSMIMDYERGQSDVIRPHPWQTDTCIGDWHYRRSIYENHQYKTPDQVIKTLLDVVSKNGNLLLSIPVRGDGTIDSDEVAFLKSMAAWMGVNGEAIFASRPWTLYGEGPVKVGGGGFNEAVRPYGPRDFRFTTKNNTLYAFALGWPDDGKLIVRTLAANAPGLVGKIHTVSLLGSPEKLTWRQTADGLEVTVPVSKPCDHAYALKIEGLNLAASHPIPPPPPAVRADANGLMTLTPDTAVPHGRVNAQGGAVPNLGYWDNAGDTVSWTVHFDAPGTYAVSAKTSAANGPTAFVLDTGAGASAPMAVPKTGGWDDYVVLTGGTLRVAAAGDHVLTVRAADPASWQPMNLAFLILRKEH